MSYATHKHQEKSEIQNQNKQTASMKSMQAARIDENKSKPKESLLIFYKVEQKFFGGTTVYSFAFSHKLRTKD